MKTLLVFGDGGHGNVVAETAEACGYTSIKFIDDNNEKVFGKKFDLE